jgi:hypothetical protein
MPPNPRLGAEALHGLLQPAPGDAVRGSARAGWAGGLRRLNLGYCGGVDDVTALLLALGCVGLEALVLNGGYLTDTGLGHLAAASFAPQLRELSLCECRELQSGTALQGVLANTPQVIKPSSHLSAA